MTSDRSPVDGQRAWADFCDRLRRAGDHLLAPDVPRDPLTQAEGMRHLSRLLRFGLESFVEHRDAEFPVLHRNAHETIKLGGDNPDIHYQTAAIDGRYEYRVHGHRGTVHYLGFGTQAGDYGSDGTLRTTGYRDARELDVGPDGALELIVSAREQPGNWLPMSPRSSLLLVRQTFADRTTEVPATLAIERLGAEGARPEVADPERVARGLEAAARFVDGTVRLFAGWTREFRTYERNRLVMMDPERTRRVGGDPNIRYLYGFFEIGSDEALVVETAVPSCEYWNFQLNNFWMESLDYRHHSVSLNHHTARAEPDGRVRIVVAHRQPARGHWLDTAGHPFGVLMWRWVGAREHPIPSVRRVPFDAVD